MPRRSNFANSFAKLQKKSIRIRNLRKNCTCLTFVHTGFNTSHHPRPMCCRRKSIRHRSRPYNRHINRQWAPYSKSIRQRNSFFVTFWYCRCYKYWSIIGKTACCCGSMTYCWHLKGLLTFRRFNWQLQWVSGVSLRCEDESEMTEMVSRGK